MKYTEKQIEECKNYLGYCVKEGCIDVKEALNMILKKKWGEVYKIMDKGDYYANNND